jgi:ankyrin repeat protein
LNREEVAFKLIESGADLLAKNKRQYTPLHLAISSAFFDIAVKLLEAGASLHSKEWRNNKPFDLFATESLKRRFFMEADFPNRALVNNNHDLWFYLIQLSDMKVSGC